MKSHIENLGYMRSTILCLEKSDIINSKWHKDMKEYIDSLEEDFKALMRDFANDEGDIETF